MLSYLCIVFASSCLKVTLKGQIQGILQAQELSPTSCHVLAMSVRATPLKTPPHQRTHRNTELRQRLGGPKFDAAAGVLPYLDDNMLTSFGTGLLLLSVDTMLRAGGYLERTGYIRYIRRGCRKCGGSPAALRDLHFGHPSVLAHGDGWEKIRYRHSCLV